VIIVLTPRQCFDPVVLDDRNGVWPVKVLLEQFLKVHFWGQGKGVTPVKLGIVQQKSK